MCIDENFCIFAVMKIDDVKYYAIIGALKLIAMLPLKILYGISDFMHFFIYRVAKYRRNIVRYNLLLSFPGKSREEIIAIEKEFYRHFCDCFVETIKLLHISDKEIKRRVVLKNPEVVTELAADGRPIILYLGHYGNWEWVQSMAIMLEKPDVMGALYKPLRNKVMDRVMLHIRSRFNILCIPAKTAYRMLLKLKQETPSFMIGFLADQRPTGNSVKHWTTFLNQPTAFVIGGETIGERMDAHYLYVECIRERRGFYSLHYIKMNPPADDSEPYPYTRLFLSMLEQTIRRNPPYWLWSHKRWSSYNTDSAAVLSRHPKNTHTQ